MPFDVIGILLTTAAKKGLEAAFTQSLRAKLRDAINDWAEETSKTAEIFPEALFSNIEFDDQGDLEKPYLNQLSKKFLELCIPSQEDWLNSLMEQWRFIKTEQKDKASGFFKLDEKTAQHYLQDLANKLHKIFLQEEKFAMPYMAEGIDKLSEKVDRVLVTLDEQKYLQRFRSIPQNLELNMVSYKIICDAARSIALKKGLRFSTELHYKNNGKMSVLLLYSESDNLNFDAVFEINENLLRAWANLQDTVLNQALSGSMFSMPLFDSVEQNWNALCTFIGRIAELLYPNSRRDGAYSISARYDLKRIGIPIPVTSNYDQNSEEIIFMKLGNDDHVPFLTFSESDLNQLTRIGEAEAGGHVAQWLYSKWGPPTVFPN